MCLMYIGEKLSAFVAFEEVMYIRMKNYEEGDEMANIAADVWLLLHNNRLMVMKSQEKTWPQIFHLYKPKVVWKY